MVDTMKRWHEDYKITLREWKKHRRSHTERNKDWQKSIGVSAYVVDCECDEQKGRFRKKDAFDCGNKKCYMCHSDKFPKRSKSKQEIEFDLKFQEQIQEFWNEFII
jgi:hypothetical protein